MRLNIWFILISMIQDNQFAQELDKLSICEVFERQDLCFEEILSIKDIQNKIKRNMKVFVEYCRAKPQFTERLVSLGLKCPMHQSNNMNMKSITYIAADILTSDHETLADLFIFPSNKKLDEEEILENGDQIEEEIETEDLQAFKQNQVDKYTFLVKILDYINSPDLDENCLNYIAKALYILIRRKLSEFLQFFFKNEGILKKLVSIAHYPSVAHLLAKLIADDEDNISVEALQVKTRLIPLLLTKVHDQIGQRSTSEVLECIQDALNSSRYGDQQQRSQLQKMSDVMVKSTEINFFIQTIKNALEGENHGSQNFFSVLNSSIYLCIIITRMNMDEQQQDFQFGQPQNFKPTLLYEIDGLFLSFCKIAKLYSKIWQFSEIKDRQYGFAAVRIIQPLVLMTKHSRFGQFYVQIELQERLSSVQALIHLSCSRKLNGILLQNIAYLIEKMIICQQQLAQTSQQIISPSCLFKVIKKEVGSIGDRIKVLSQQTKNLRNKNQIGIYFRKILLLLDNYFKSANVLKRYPETESLQNIFPTFSSQLCKIFSQSVLILNHPNGVRTKDVEQFAFIKKNRNFILAETPEEKAQQKEQQKSKGEIQVGKQTKKTVELVFKLSGRINAHKQKVKQKNTDKDQINISNSLSIPNQSLLPPEVPKQSLKIPVQSSSREPKSKQQSGLNFFIRHLMIY